MVKIRLRKHRDLMSPRRFGWTNTLITVDLILVRIVLPVIAVWELFAMSLSGPMHTPEILDCPLLADGRWGSSSSF